MPQKKEVVVWIRLTDYQLSLYRRFLVTDKVREVMNTPASPLEVLNVLRKICQHPVLLNKDERAAMEELEPIGTCLLDRPYRTADHIE